MDRLRGLKVEQELLIKELRLIQEHLEGLDTVIADIVKFCREGQILLSIPAIGEGAAATIIAIIEKSETDPKLRAQTVSTGPRR
jgi:transposase